jgi:uncharacterized protein (TIGR01244 family)
MIKHLAAVALAALMLSTGVAGAAPAQAPFGDEVGPAFTNYNRAWPTIGSAGALGEGAAEKAKALGFRTVVDLRTPQEGVAEEKAKIEGAGLTYINIPVATRAPTPAQVEEFAKLVADESLMPMLVHCASANRVGAMWALYRAGQGVDPMVAVEEGRVLGLKPSREGNVREQLGLPPMEE